MPAPLNTRSTAEILAAFDADGWAVVEQTTKNGYRGMAAESKTAFNAHTKRKKRAYYLEGGPYELGWLMGRLAPRQVINMGTNYTTNVIPAFVDPSVTDGGTFRWLVKLLVELIEELDKGMLPDVPPELVAEIHGLVDGVKAAKPNAKLAFDDLWTLNFGVDWLLALLYSPASILAGLGVKPGMLRPVPYCNSFSAWGAATKGGVHYFGRDFMFPSANVFQHAACMAIVNPAPTQAGPGTPFLTMTAPGFVGSISAMNRHGVAMGVDMLPGGNCDADRPGFNSLGLVRYAVQHGGSATDIVDIVRGAQRGVSWVYPVSDAKNHTACVIEAGRKGVFDPLSFPSAAKKNLLPDAAALAKDPAQIQDGMFVRWPDYQVPASFLGYNKALFADEKLTYDASIFQQHGTWGPDGNVKDDPFPGPFLFSPTNLGRTDVQVACNTYLSPKMRFAMMDPWTADVGADQWNDLQWRYDALTWLVNDSAGQIDAERARAMIDMLSPAGALYRRYYQYPGRKMAGWKRWFIDGSVSLFDLTNQTVTSHWGDYGDEWVGLALPRYVP